MTKFTSLGLFYDSVNRVKLESAKASTQILLAHFHWYMDASIAKLPLCLDRV